MGPHSSKHGDQKKYHVSKAQEPSSRKSESANTARQFDLSELAVITAIFNPIKYRTRYDHYQKFASHMSQSDVQLYTVECIFDSTDKFGLPKQDFEITRAGNPHHIQLRAPSIMWMKENLINIGVQHLPQTIKYIAWIDADIEFERLDWPQLTISELQRYPIVQLFELSYFLGPGGKKDILRRDYSFGYSIRHNKPIEPQRYHEWYAHPGYAWAMHRSAFTRIGGLIDFCIIGSGDLHFAFALLNRIQETLRPNLHPDYRNLAITWGNRVAQLAQNGSNVSYIPANLYHYWHGERNDRNYVDRWMILEKHQYSPLEDLEKNDANGLLRLTDKINIRSPQLVARIDALERDIVAYFISRKEDNNVKTNQIKQPVPPNKAKPFVARKTQPNRAARGGGSRHTGGLSGRPAIWSSGPSGTHVDDDDPFWDQCRCPGHHHHPGNHNCPCSPDHGDDPHCWNPSEGEHHHHHHDNDDNQHGWNPSQDEHHHHHHHHDNDNNQHGWNPSQDEHHHHDTGYTPDDHFGGHHSSHGHDWTNTDNNTHNYDYSSGGGGYHNTDYGGAGSFY